MSDKIMKFITITKNVSKYEFTFFPYRKVREKNSPSHGNFDLSSGHKANSQPAAT